MAMLNGNISKINGSAGNLSSKQTGGQTIVSLSHTLTFSIYQESLPFILRTKSRATLTGSPANNQLTIILKNEKNLPFAVPNVGDGVIFAAELISTCRCIYSLFTNAQSLTTTCRHNGCCVDIVNPGRRGNICFLHNACYFYFDDYLITFLPLMI